MNYEVIDSPRRIAAQDACQTALAQAELAMHDDFVSACKAGDVNARCEWAPLAVQRSSDGTYRHSKVQTLDDVMAGSLDYGKGPSTTDVMALLLQVAFGADNVNNPARARVLIDRMASTFARFNTDEA